MDVLGPGLFECLCFICIPSKRNLTSVLIECLSMHLLLIFFQVVSLSQEFFKIIAEGQC